VFLREIFGEGEGVAGSDGVLLLVVLAMRTKHSPHIIVVSTSSAIE